MPIGSPVSQHDTNKYKSNSSPTSYGSSQNLIRPELVRPLQTHQGIVTNSNSSSNATSVIRIGGATSNVPLNKILPSINCNPTHLIPILPAHIEKIDSKNDTVSSSTYQWHTLLPVINSPSISVITTQHSLKNISSPKQIECCYSEIEKGNQSMQMPLVSTDSFENDEEPDDDDEVFETAPVKSIHATHTVNRPENMITPLDKNEKDSVKMLDTDTSAKAACSENDLYVLNKRRTQSCSAIQASKDSQSPIKVRFLNTKIYSVQQQRLNIARILNTGSL